MRVANHTLLTPITECVTILYKCQFSEFKPSQVHFWAPSSLARQLLVRVVNHKLLLIRSVSQFSVSSVSYTLTDALLSTIESCSAVTSAHSTPHTDPMEGVTILYKCQFSEFKPSQTHFWAPASFSFQSLVHVVNHTLLLIRSVSWFSTNVRSVSYTRTDALLSITESFSAVTRACSESHTTPNTECVRIFI